MFPEDWIASSKTLHVLSDQHDTVAYLRSVLPGWRVLRYDCHNRDDVDLFREIVQDGPPAMVCCSDDDASSIAFASEVLSTDSPSEMDDKSEYGQNLLVLLRRNDSLASLRAVLGRQGQKVSAICVDDIHESLFAVAREELRKGTSPTDLNTVHR